MSIRDILSNIERTDPALLAGAKKKLAASRLELHGMFPPAVGASLETLLELGMPEPVSIVHPPFNPGVGPRVFPPAAAARAAEAIILRLIRPSLLVKGGTFADPEDGQFPDEVKAFVDVFDRSAINRVIRATGRVEFGNVPGMLYGGTGWIIDKPTATSAWVITNRHVAQIFARPDGAGRYPFRLLPNMDTYQVKVDFIEEYGAAVPVEVNVGRVLFMSDHNGPDAAILLIESNELASFESIRLKTALPARDDMVGVVGYPAYDSRNDPEAIREYFGDIFNVKRFSFGRITGFTKSDTQILHDATTLGGNSGSVVFDLQSGEAIGLHFAGRYGEANYAVAASDLRAILGGLTRMSSPHMAPEPEAAADPVSRPEDFAGRDGYNPDFLGKKFSVAAPFPGEKWEDDLTPLSAAEPGADPAELKYRHFSVWMSASRKTPLITAVNINGAKSKRLARIKTWRLDGRIDPASQLGNAFYVATPIDRGHMVRREDPVWGTLQEAHQANWDSFHYTNSAPQHSDLNEREWLALEDYVLSNARTHAMKVSAFTGPIFQDDDQTFRDMGQIPKAFWKIIAAVVDTPKRLSITGYILCQGSFLRTLTDEFVYGEFRTYQVPLWTIAEQAQLDLEHMLDFDPLATSPGIEALRQAMQVVDGLETLTL